MTHRGYGRGRILVDVSTHTSCKRLGEQFSISESNNERERWKSQSVKVDNFVVEVKYKNMTNTRVKDWKKYCRKVWHL